jgi:casein kinase II subunit beta
MSYAASMSWVEWFLCVEPRGRFFVKIDGPYIRDTFNVYGLRNKIGKNFKWALDTIRGPYVAPNRRQADCPADLDEAAIRLYGLLHARYLLTKSAMEQMRDKYMNGDFCRCPRTFCEQTLCLPYGRSDEVDESSLMMFCPKCREVYLPEDEVCARIDGAFFGTSWIHMFMQEWAHIFPRGTLRKPSLRLFGFRIETSDDLAEEEP